MSRIVVRLERRVKLKLRRMRRETKDKGLAVRCQIVLLAAEGRRRATSPSPWGARLVGQPRGGPVPGLGVGGLAGPAGGQRAGEAGRVVPGGPARGGGPKPAGLRLPAARPGRGSCWPRSCSRSPGVQVHPATMSRALAKIGAQAGPAAADGGLPLARFPPEKRAWPHIGQALVAAGGSRGGVPGRGGHAPEPQDRAGLDEPGDAEGGADAGQERQTLPLRGDGRRAPGC